MAPPTLQSSTTGVSAGSDPSPRVDPVDQKEIEAIWKEVYAKVVELAGGDAKKIRQSLSIDDVLGYIDKVQKADNQKSEEYGTFKNIVSKTLQCISTVGGIVADGASNVFAPAGMCYNALTFVIQAWQGYEGTFANLAELLEKCVEFLERLQSYQGRMDSRLARVASQNLRLFIEICDRIIKLRKKHTRFLRFTKQLFLNDDGVQDLLSMMDKLNSKEALLVSAQTYRLVSDSAGDIKVLLETQKEQRREDDAKKWRRSLAKALGFPEGTLDSDREPVPVWQRAFETRLNQLVEGTGTWWKEDDSFRHWATAKFPEESILVLSGAAGTGKTSMMANTIKAIRRLGCDAPSSRVVTAYSFAEADKRKADDDDESTTIERVTRTLLWQLATSYEAMTKTVASVVDRVGHFDGALDMWDQLFFRNKERQNSSTTFYIFIDSFDPELVPLLQRYSGLDDRAKVRVFLTARPEMITGYLGPVDGIAYADVPIARRNSQDVEKYIISQMDSMPILRDTTRQGISEWREVIKNELRDKCAGDYFKLNTSLSALAKVDLIEDVREVLEEAGRPRTDQIRAEIRRLNNTRTLKEINEINEIILWVDSGRWFFPPEAMDSILSVKHRASSATDETAFLPTISLLPLAQKLREKYTLFSITDSGVIDWRNSEIKGHIPTKGAQQDDTIRLDGSSPSPSQVIQESEISIVRHFLTNVCPPDLFRRFEFDEFFNQKLGAGLKEYIHLDPDNAEIRIAYTCLVILTDEDLREKEKLHRYAIYWLFEHLEAVDLSVADRELKAKVGPLLVRLFTEDTGIDSLFWLFDENVSMKTWELAEASYLREARVEWLYSAVGVQEIARWFNDSSVTKYISDEVGQKFVAAVKAPNANLHEAVLSHAARRMATHLFIRIEFLKRHFLTAASFLRGYLARLEGDAEMPNMPGIYRDSASDAYAKWESKGFPLSQLEKIEAWAFKQLPDAKATTADESLWEIHGAFQAFQLCDDEHQKAEVSERRAKRAVELNPNNWHACHFVSGRPSMSAKEGLEILTRVKKSVDDIRAKEEGWMDISANTSLLARVTLDLGNKLWELGDFAAAARTHRESLSYNYVHFSAYARILGRYQEREEWGELIAFMETLNETSAIWDAYFDELINEFISYLTDDNPQMLAQAADATNRWDAIEKFFTVAEEIGSRQQAYDLLFLLRDGHAQILEFTTGAVDEKSVIAARVAALESIRAHPSDTLPQAKINELVDMLAMTYLDQAFRPDTPEEKVQSIGSLISGLLPDVDEALNAWENVVTICCIIRYHHRLKTGSETAKRWAKRVVRAALELLSDDDTGNDDYAYWLLAGLFTTVEDVVNAQIAENVRNAIQARSLAKWEDWVTTPITSPMKRASGSEGTIANRIAPPPSHERTRSSSRSSGHASVHSHSSSVDHRPAHGSTGTSIASHTTTPTEDAESHEKPHPSKISTDVVEPSMEGAPPKPAQLVACDGCDRWWTVMEEPLYTCADCVGQIQLDQQCYDLLMKDQLKTRGFRCKKTHTFIQLPAWDAARFKDMPKGYLPIPASVSQDNRWISCEEWKKKIQSLYLPDEE
ncbi:hypothetical protein F5Y17DRAFT_234248 [Xylariaceae sp. FL0594]|nr:hypothetical protein F5Y17DRAFT_234248 [Xylariaceae sp. FL0594]